MLLEGKNVIFEKYYPNVERETPVISFSRAKSITSIAVGKALCERKISLQDPVSKYIPEVKDNVYGKAKIVSVLSMSSGASTGLPHGDVVQGETSRWAQGVKSQLDTLLQYDAVFLSGEGTFKYKNQDPSTIGIVLDRVYNKGIEEYFQKNVWETIRAKSSATWMLDKASVPISSSYLIATTGDWGRAGLYVNSILRRDTNDECMFNYFKDATSLQKRTDEKQFQGYGYYFWTNQLMDRKNEIIWMRGVGGQLVAMHPGTNKVMVYNSLNGSNADEVATAFVQWVYQ